MVYWVILHPEGDAAEPNERAPTTESSVGERLGPFESRERARAVGAAERAARERPHQLRPVSTVRPEVVCDYA